MTDVTSHEPIDVLIEVRWEGKHSSSEEISTIAVRDTAPNIDALVERIEFRGVWAEAHVSDPKSAPEAWSELFESAPPFDEAPRPKPALVSEVIVEPTGEEGPPPSPPTEMSVRALYFSTVVSAESPVLRRLRDRLVAGLTSETTWVDLDQRLLDLRREMDLDGPGNRTPEASGASQLSRGIHALATREGPSGQASSARR